MSDGERNQIEAENANLNNSPNNSNINENINNVQNIRENIPINAQPKYINNNFTLLFIFITLIRTILFIYQSYYNFHYEKYTFQYWPILMKNQYYRLITHHFLSYSILQLVLESYISFRIMIMLEKILGTFLAFIYTFSCMIIISCANLILVFLFKNIFASFKYIQVRDYNFYYECGLTPILLNIYTFTLSFLTFRDNRVQFFVYLNLKQKQIPWIIFFVLLFVTPNKTSFGNFNGIIIAIFFKKFGKYIFPDPKCVVEFEKNFGLYNEGNKIYRYIDLNNKKMLEFIKDFYENKYTLPNDIDEIDGGTEMNDISDNENIENIDNIEEVDNIDNINNDNGNNIDIGNNVDNIDKKYDNFNEGDQEINQKNDAD